MSLRIKTLAAITLVLAISAGGSFLVLIQHQRAQFLRNTADAATHLTNTIKATLEHAMLTNDSPMIQHIVRMVGEQPEVEGVFILDHNGVVKVASDQDQVGRPLREGQVAWPADIHGAQTGKESFATVLQHQPSPVLRITSLIPTASRCQSCHPANPQALGALVVDRSLAQMEQQLRAGLAYMLGSAGLAFLLLTGTTYAVLRRLVVTPLAELGEGARAIEAGKYDTPIAAHSRDEIGDLARTLDQMRHRIAERTRDLQASQLQLIQSEKMAGVGTLAAGIAHELNQPLMVIRGYAQELLADERLGDEESREDLKRIEAQTTRMAAIITHLRDFARQSKGKHQATDLSHIVMETLTFVGQQLKLRNIAVVTDFAADLPRVWADPFQLEQVVLNLLTNARDALAPEGCGTVTVRTRRVPAIAGFGLQISDLETVGSGNLQSEISNLKSGEFVELAVTDTGPGIPPEVQSRIFDPFFTTKDVGKGTGLGLSICYGIIQEHGGEIRVESPVAEGRGTRFTVVLPFTGPSDKGTGT